MKNIYSSLAHAKYISPFWVTTFLLLLFSNGIFAQATLLDYKFNSSTAPAIPNGVVYSAAPDAQLFPSSSLTCTVCSPGRLIVNPGGFVEFHLNSLSELTVNMRSNGANARSLPLSYRKLGDAGFTSLGTVTSAANSTGGTSIDLVASFSVLATPSPIIVRLDGPATGAGNNYFSVLAKGALNPDLDGDGVPDATDCAPADPLIGIITWYKDADNDGYSDGTTLSQCTRPIGYKLLSELLGTESDCDDADFAIKPGALEICTNGIDEDCDGNIDTDCDLFIWYRDADGDGFGRTSRKKISPTQPTGFVATPGDCNDNDPNTYPGADEVGDGQDNDCDGVKDEDLPCLKTWYEDNDGDGYGRTSRTKFLCVQPTGYVLTPGDCDDNNPDSYPDAEEIEDGKDNNCNGVKDENLPCIQTWYEDNDGDGYGRTSRKKFLCNQPTGYVLIPGDCNDKDASINPGESEVCGDNIDNNCNGVRDENCTAPLITQKRGAEEARMLSSKEGITSKGIRLYPNPAISELNISLDNFKQGEQIVVNVIDIQGKAVASKSTVNVQQPVRFNVSRLQGIYLVQAIQGNTRVVEKVMIRP